MLLPSLPFSLVVGCLLGEVAYYFDCSSNHSSDYSANPGLDSGFGFDSANNTGTVVAGFVGSHTERALLSSSLIGILLCYAVLHKILRFPKG